jgi:hypothetical protein
MRRLWMIAATAMLGCSPAFAQVGGVSVPTPGIAATSPLGMSGALQPGTSVGPTGIPLGATELPSPGISPMLNDPTSVMALGTTCSGGSASTGISGGISGISTYDGGGLAVGGATGTGTTLAGDAAPCAAAAAGSASPTASVPTSPGGASRTGIPLGSVEIGSAGVSPLISLPAPALSSSSAGTFGSSPSILGMPSAPPFVAPRAPAPAGPTGITTNIPCPGGLLDAGPGAAC